MRIRPNIYITRPIPQAAVDTLLIGCDVSLCDSSGDYVPREEVLRGVRGVNAILCMPTDKIDKEVIQLAGPELRVVATMSEDYDHIDNEECKRRGIQVLTIPEDSNETVVDLTIALLLQAVVQKESDDEEDPVIRSNPRSLHTNKGLGGSFSVEMSNRTLGIYKLGRLGLSIAKRLKNLGISRIVYHDVAEVLSAEEVGAEFVSFEQLLSESDILCLCSERRTKSGTTIEENMFDKKSFKKMPKSAILIEVTKSPLLDYKDLYTALKEGEIQCAGLNVREYDTTPYKHQLSGLSNCHFLPYRECYEWDGRREISVSLANEILSALSNNGNPL
ncbi:hypothetical protein CHS0354_001194 [Potamilus streckersoni]|uniref:Uncharacterized protein n=1 Tax=Potamilus streckersoni TaxID=2493646 RepID=A0AAE0RMC3_9BIVA|nr:hypothetical protein CHS0354_001194 [Potamilus streckersoni]